MKLVNCYPQIISDQNLWLAWRIFRSGKGRRLDVCLFERHLETNLSKLRRDLSDGSYEHGRYHAFVVHDPKQRYIHVPAVRDQVVHQAVWNILFPFFNKRFSPSVTSCRPGKGTSAARAVIRRWGRLRRSKFVLHMDVVKCFDSISHSILTSRLGFWIDCSDTMALLERIVKSFSFDRGIPLGNLTSQLFCNVVFMDFDRQIDRAIGVGNWVRYADDVFVRGASRESLRDTAETVASILKKDGLFSRSVIRPYDGFEALGVRWFQGGFESIARSTRLRALRLAAQRAGTFASGSFSQSALRATFHSLRGLSVDDLRWTNCLRNAILEAI